MTRTIYKYSVIPTDYFRLQLPVDAQILTVQMQGNEAFVWTLLNPDEPVVERTFRLAGTGHPIVESPNALSYVGTFQMGGGRLVWHLFEVLVHQIEGAINDDA